MHLRLTPLFLSIAFLPDISLAQANYVSTVDSGASAFTWTGNTSLGAIVGNPNTFNLSGSLTLRLTPGVTQPIGLIKLKEGNALVSPDISGEIPNPLPFLPPLATIDITGLSLSVSSDAVALAANGDFSTTAIFTALTGIMVIDAGALGGTTLDLTGSQSDPTVMSGNLSYAGGAMHFDSPVSLSFAFTDAGTGVSGTVTLNGDVISDYSCPGATSYCSSSANSTGGSPLMGMGGSTSVFANDLSLNSNSLPAGQPGIFYYGPNQIAQVFGNGTRCVGGTVVRLGAVVASGSGDASFSLDNGVAPNLGVILPGATRQAAGLSST
ncbi:MAG: hypothetical protein ACI841_001984 [Planctomycetota bacterium]|jgi:hypothetical protein